MLNIYPRTLQPDATAFVVFQGPPNRELTWAVIGAGTLSKVQARSNARGVATALFTPSAADQHVEIQVNYVP